MHFTTYLKNILYIIGICIIAFPFVLINYLQINTINHNSDIAISFSIFDYIYSINPFFIIFILIIPVIVLDRIQKIKLLYSIGLNFDRFAFRDAGIGIVFGIIALAITILFITNNHLQLPNLDSVAIIFFIVLSEELFFRGYLFQNIYKKNNSMFAIVFSSFLFASSHFIGGGFDVIYFLNIFIAGILFCVMYAKTKSLWCGISFHFIWNIISTSNSFIEQHYLCGIVLLIFIFISLKLLKPSYKINKYYLVNIE